MQLLCLHVIVYIDCLQVLSIIACTFTTFTMLNPRGQAVIVPVYLFTMINPPGHTEPDVQGNGIDKEPHHSETHRHHWFDVSGREMFFNENDD